MSTASTQFRCRPETLRRYAEETQRHRIENAPRRRAQLAVEIAEAKAIGDDANYIAWLQEKIAKLP